MTNNNNLFILFYFVFVLSTLVKLAHRTDVVGQRSLGLLLQRGGHKATVAFPATDKGPNGQPN